MSAHARGDDAVPPTHVTCVAPAERRCRAIILVFLVRQVCWRDEDVRSARTCLCLQSPSLQLQPWVPIYKISYDLSEDYLDFIIRSIHDSYL